MERRSRLLYLLLVLALFRACAAQETSRTRMINSTTIRAVIDERTGALLSLHDSRDGDQLLRSSYDTYKLERKAGDEITASESEDRVIAVERGKSICENAKLPGLRIEKEWLANDCWLAKRVSFATDKEDLGFLKYSTSSTVAPEFYEDGYLNDPSRHPLDYPYLFVRDLKSERQIFDHNKFADHHLAIFANPKQNRGLAQYRFAIDGRFVHPLTGYSYEPGLFYGPDGWRIAVAAQWLTRGQSLSCEVRWHLFDGDHVAFHREYMALPEFAREWSYKSPDWTKDVRAVMAWTLSGSSPRLTKYKKALQAIDHGYILVVMSGLFHNTREYMADPIPTPIGVRIPAGELRKVVDQLHALSPRIKVGPCTWQWAFGELDPVFHKRPEWTVHDADGNPVFATTGWSGEKVYSQLLTPECRQYVLSQFGGMVKRYDFDFIYMDSGQGGVTRFDWKTKRCAQDYDWADLYQGIREAARSNRNGIAFFNGTPRLYSSGCDCGYFEGVGFIRVHDWRALADRLFLVKLYQPGDKWTIPLYWRPNVKELYANYCLALALKPNWQVLSPRWPIDGAVEELRDARLATEANVRPCWWKEETNIEAYALRLPGGAILSAINHGETAKQVTLSCDLAPFGFDMQKPLHIWEFTPRSVAELEESVAITEAQANVIFTRDGNAPHRAIVSRFIGSRKAGESRFEHKVEIVQGHLKLILLTQSPRLAYAVDGRPTHFLLPPKDMAEVKTIPADRPPVPEFIARREGYVLPEELRTSVFVPPRSSPEKVNRSSQEVNREINGVKVRRFLTFDCEHNSENQASFDMNTLSLKVDMGLEKIAGFATSGIEADNLGRVTLKVDYKRPRYDLYTTRMGSCFAGFVCDYHAPDGYVRRVFFPIAPYGEKLATSSRPWWGVFENKNWKGRSYIIPLKAQREMVIDLGLYAPAEWDRRTIFAAAVENCGYGTRIEAQVIGNGPPGNALAKMPMFPVVKDAKAIALFQEANIFRLENGAKMEKDRIVLPSNACVEGKGFGVVTWKITRGEKSSSALILVNYKLNSGEYKLATIDISDNVPPGGEAQFDIDLNQYAPADWSGRCRIRLRGSDLSAEIVANSTFQIF